MNESTVQLLVSVDESTDIVCSGVRLKGHAHPLVAVAVSKKRVHVLHGPELIPLRIVSLPACVCSLSFTVKRNKRAIASLAILCYGGLLFVVPCPLPEQMPDDSRPPKFNSLSLGTFVRLEASHAAASFAPVHRSLLLQAHQRAHVIAADPCGYIQSDPAMVAMAGASMPLHVSRSTLTSAVVPTTSSAPAASWGVVSSFASLEGNTALRQVVMAPPTCFAVVSRSASDSQTRAESKILAGVNGVVKLSSAMFTMLVGKQYTFDVAALCGTASGQVIASICALALESGNSIGKEGHVCAEISQTVVAVLVMGWLEHSDQGGVRVAPSETGERGVEVVLIVGKSGAVLLKGIANGTPVEVELSVPCSVVVSAVQCGEYALFQTELGEVLQMDVREVMRQWDAVRDSSEKETGAAGKLSKAPPSMQSQANFRPLSLPIRVCMLSSVWGGSTCEAVCGVSDRGRAFVLPKSAPLMNWSSLTTSTKCSALLGRILWLTVEEERLGAEEKKLDMRIQTCNLILQARDEFQSSPQLLKCTIAPKRLTHGVGTWLEITCAYSGALGIDALQAQLLVTISSSDYAAHTLASSPVSLSKERPIGMEIELPCTFTSSWTPVRVHVALTFPCENDQGPEKPFLSLTLHDGELDVLDMCRLSKGAAGVAARSAPLRVLCCAHRSERNRKLESFSRMLSYPSPGSDTRLLWKALFGLAPKEQNSTVLLVDHVSGTPFRAEFSYPRGRVKVKIVHNGSAAMSWAIDASLVKRINLLMGRDGGGARDVGFQRSLTNVEQTALLEQLQTECDGCVALQRAVFDAQREFAMHVSQGEEGCADHSIQEMSSAAVQLLNAVYHMHSRLRNIRHMWI